MSLNKDMGDTHEEFLSALFEGRQTKGSGNQWHNPMDGNTSRMHCEYAFSWDGKSTLGKSIGVSLTMWDKARQQAGGNRPMLGLRFYANEKLQPVRDLVVLDAHHAAEVIEAANTLAAVKAWCKENEDSHGGFGDAVGCILDLIEEAGR